MLENDENGMEEQDQEEEIRLHLSQCHNHSACRALAIDNVLEGIMSHSSYADLKRFRSVSTLWMKESMNFWRDNAVLRILGSTRPPDSEGINMEQLLEILVQAENGDDLYNLRNKPFKCFELNGFKSIATEKFNREQGEYRMLTRGLFEQVRVSHLTLSNCEFQSVNEFRKVILVTFPYLEELKLRGDITFKTCSNQNVGLEECPKGRIKRLILEYTSKLFFPLRFPWKQFFEKMPELEVLGINFTFKNVREEINQIFIDLDNSRILSKIKSLEVFATETEETPWAVVEFIDIFRVYLFVFRRIPLLERLGAHISLNSFALSILESAVFYKETVQFLRVSVNLDIHIPSYQIDLMGPTVFPLLKEFRLIYVTNFTFRVFQFLRNLRFPQLEKLVLEKGFDMQPDLMKEEECSREDAIAIFQIEMHERPYPHLHTFELHGERCIPSSIYLEAMSYAMPNLKRLTIPLTSRTFPTVCKCWPNLEYLKVLQSQQIINAGEELTDEVITGIYSEAGTFQVDCITSLKELSDLEICSDRSDSKLTGKSALNGFLLLPSLHHLNVTFKEISTEVQKALREKINFLEMKVQTDIEIDE